jgi:phosphoribosylanthranilate isomerase
MSIVKVCGMRDTENIYEVDGLGIDWMGFIFYPPSPRFAGWDFRVPSILKALPIGVFVNESNETIETTVYSAGLKGIQLHGNESPEQCHSLYKNGLILIKVFGIGDDFDFSKVKAYESCVDYLLFDTATAQKGGSGLKFNHRLLEDYKGNTPFILSGGIGPYDVEKLKAIGHPLLAGIDLNSRFEISPAKKNIEQLKKFIDDYRTTH